MTLCVYNPLGLGVMKSCLGRPPPLPPGHGPSGTAAPVFPNLFADHLLQTVSKELKPRPVWLKRAFKAQHLSPQMCLLTTCFKRSRKS